MTSSKTDHELLDTKEAATLLRRSAATLARWRCAKPTKGPPFFKDPSTGVVLYRRSDLYAFVLRNIKNAVTGRC